MRTQGIFHYFFSTTLESSKNADGIVVPGPFWLNAIREEDQLYYRCNDYKDKCYYKVKDHPRKGWLEIDEGTIDEKSNLRNTFKNVYVDVVAGSDPKFVASVGDTTEAKATICMTEANIATVKKDSSAGNHILKETQLTQISNILCMIST